MKRTVLAILLAFCLVLVSVIPAFATQVELREIATADQVPTDTTVLSDNVKKLYDAYLNLQKAIDECDIEALEIATAEFEEVYNNSEELTDEEYLQLEELFDTDALSAIFILIEPYISANVVLEYAKYYNAYTADKNTKTAYDYVGYHDVVFNDPDYQDEALQEDILSFFPDAMEVFAQAKEDMPTQKAIDFYQAYIDIVDAIYWGSADDLQTAVDNFLEAYNNIGEQGMTQAEQKQMGDLFGMPFEDAISEAEDRYINANIILQMDVAVNDFYDNETKETAQTIVDMYNSIYNSENFHSDSLEEDIDTYFSGGFEETYLYALEILEDNNENDSDNDTDTETDKDKKPQTSGDSQKNENSTDANYATVKTGANSVVVYLTGAMMFLSYAVMMLVKIRKKQADKF